MFNTSYPDTAYKNPLPCYLSVGHKIFLRHPELYYIPAFLHTKNAVLSIPAKLNLCLCCNQGELSGHIRMYPLLCFEISNMVTSAPKRARGIAFFPQEPHIFCSHQSHPLVMNFPVLLLATYYILDNYFPFTELINPFSFAGMLCNI